MGSNPIRSTTIFHRKISLTTPQKLVGKNVDMIAYQKVVIIVDNRCHCYGNGLHTQPGRKLSQNIKPFGGLLGSSAEEGRAKPRYYSVQAQGAYDAEIT